jgi:murein DD-endopeptidase MepM/ murein hydrolase activator NlpD
MSSPLRFAPVLSVTVLLFAAGAAADPSDHGSNHGEEPASSDEPTLEEELAMEPDVGCDASAGGEADVEELLADEPPDRTIPAEMPTRWLESEGRQCRRYHRRRVCDGPRRVPEPFGPAAELASQLGLDERQVARIALHDAPPASWVEAVEGETGPGLLWPVEGGQLWRGFGRHSEILPRRRGRPLRRGRRRILQPGVDIGAPAGTPIRAVNDGLVVYSYNGVRGYGNVLLLVHADGTLTLYGHCRATYVFAGQQVQRGQVIAEVGDTGLAHGAHLHFEWRRAGHPVNPLPFFVGRESEDHEPEAPAADAPGSAGEP